VAPLTIFLPNSQPDNKVKEGFTKSYFKSNNMTTFKKHANANHVLIAKNFEEEMNNNMKSSMEK
jgi:hypothetical protein